MTNAGEHAVAEAFGEVADRVNGYMTGWLDSLGEVADEVAAVIEPSAVGTLGEDSFMGLADGFIRRLEGASDMLGLGFLVAPGVIRDRDRYLLWFQKRETGIRRLKLNLAADDPDLYDYLDTDWFIATERRRGPALYGPYVDYAGADFLILTVAVPVLVGDRFVGAAGADLDPDVVEGALVARLRELPGEAVIVAEDRSVVAAGSARWMPGERLAVHPASESQRWLAQAPLAAWTGWTLAVAAPGRA
ncbi:hypothetical protein JCM18899A_23330 [Nocardioides sp. AN3]